MPSGLSAFGLGAIVTTASAIGNLLATTVERRVRSVGLLWRKPERTRVAIDFFARGSVRVHTMDRVTRCCVF
jgi:hypothetical protein